MTGKWILGLTAAALLAGCNSVETTRGTPVMAEPPHVAAAVDYTRWSVADVRVIVPDALVVSEANVYIPSADIVWREDPEGDRKAQVATILDAAITRGTAHLHGPKSVYVDIELRQFHALSDKARATVGGVHSITFDMVVRDAETGANLTEPERIEASFRALGGVQAMAALRKGLSQKVRITNHVANVLRERFGADPLPENAAVASAAPDTPHVGVIE